MTYFETDTDAIQFLTCIRENKEGIVTDARGKIFDEYRANLNPNGQPGVGDRFFLEAWRQCRRICLPERGDGEYADLPLEVIDSGFDPDDRKFAALARREGIPVANAVDSDWLHHRALLERNGIRVKFVCGCDEARWRAAGAADGEP